jgi:hypothetical protein
VDEDYLTDPNTVYPVTIDPTLTVSDNTHGAGAIEDAPIYEGYPTSNFGSYQYNRAGYAGTAYKRGRTVVRLTGLFNDSIFSNLSAGCVSSAKFYVYDATGSSTAWVNLYPLTSNSTWTESSVTWSNQGAKDETMSEDYGAVAMLGNGLQSEFIITQLVKAWKNDILDYQCGFVLEGSLENSVDRSLYSSEHTTTAKRPYVLVTYYASPTTYVYRNYFDNSLPSLSLSTRIDEIVEAATVAYSRHFPVTFSVSGSASLLNIGHCGTLSTMSIPCTNDCGSSCRSNHHKNVMRISDQLYALPRSNNEIITWWTDRPQGTYCCGEDESHVASLALACVCYKRPVIHVMDLRGNTNNHYLASMAILLIHETAHTFGMDDNYNAQPHQESGWDCVMENYVDTDRDATYAFYQAIVNGDKEAFCPDCLSKLAASNPGKTLPGNQ